MSYLVLARKYRPQVFEDVVGQDHVTRTLANAIAAERVAHAYLFCGPRGIGKTTAARILAKALNCEQGPTAVPCNTCGNCIEITAGRSLDVLEIDGASNRGINEVRELRENVRFAPAGGRSKIYIIDEVHMLTHEAFNALLKTLEEPPSHVVFVLATTEPFKLPATILSRCQRFDFARVSSRAIAAHLGNILEQEGIEASPEALSLVARRAAGGVRDALSLTDQIISAAEGPLDRPAVERILGLVGGDFYYALVDLLAEEDAAGAIRMLGEIYGQGADLGELTEGLTAHLRDLLLLRIDDSLASLVEVPESEIPRLKSQAERFDREMLTELVDRSAETAALLRRSEHPRLAVELALAEMARTAGRVPLGELARRLVKLESRLGGEDVEDEPTPPAGVKPAGPPRGRTAAGAPGGSAGAGTETKAAPGGEAASLWVQCLEAIRARSMLLWGTFHNATAVGFDQDGSLIICPPAGGGLVGEVMREAETREILAEVFAGLGRASTGVRVQGASTAGTEPAAGKKKPAKKPGPEASAAAKKTAPEPAAAKKKNVKEPPPVVLPPLEASSPEPPGEDVKPEPGEAKPAPSAPDPAEPGKAEKDADDRSMGQLFRDEPMLQKALDMFDGEVLP